MVYLFYGEDEIAKKRSLESLKKKFLNPATLEFNFDLLHAKETDLLVLQEILSRIPLDSPRRIVIIKDTLRLSPKIKDFLIGYVKKPTADTILILDLYQRKPQDAFLKAIMPYVKILNFGEAEYVSTFKLCDELERKRITPALNILHRLLSCGEKAERILGGLRYHWERNTALSPQERARRLNLLLNCDIDIKRGRLRPEFSLEKLLVNLCCF
ncbi:MAG: hypothetical protein NC936_03460 [Candidatus Omnitrophica bacterium]|nr:hypothetical protein [Candidatus Omnitrophota bacterium]MCM8770911.1 hypothetical protein [Candidatus Omnitrophota bacterium]